MESSEPPESSGPAESGNEGLSGLLDDIKQLGADARTLVQAELGFQAARARVAGSAARGIVVSVLIAAVFAVFALGALAVGLLIALTPLVTAWGATAIVAGGLALAALLSVLSALGRWRRLKGILRGEERP